MISLNKQIENSFYEVFWNLLDDDLNQNPPNFDHVKILLNEIIQILCDFVPNRTDIHTDIKTLLDREITWDIIHELIKWIECFQPPIYDSITKNMFNKKYEKLSTFLKEYYLHLEKVHKSIHDYRKKIQENKTMSKNNIPNQMNSGK